VKLESAKVNAEYYYKAAVKNTAAFIKNKEVWRLA
jgi:hypothetical protein